MRTFVHLVALTALAIGCSGGSEDEGVQKPVGTGGTDTVGAGGGGAGPTGGSGNAGAGGTGDTPPPDASNDAVSVCSSNTFWTGADRGSESMRPGGRLHWLSRSGSACPQIHGGGYDIRNPSRAQ